MTAESASLAAHARDTGTGEVPGSGTGEVRGSGTGEVRGSGTGEVPGSGTGEVRGSEISSSGSTTAIRASYIELTGSVPAGIETRLALAERTGRHQAVEAIEALRRLLIMDNPLDRKTGQLVHFGQLVALGSAGPAHLHVRAARKAGASIADLVGVAELALITAGMPSYSLGVQIVADLLAEEDGKVDEGGQVDEVGEVGEDGFLAGGAIRPTETQRAAT